MLLSLNWAVIITCFINTALASDLYCVYHHTNSSLRNCKKFSTRPISSLATNSNASTITQNYDMTFDLNCKANENVCSGVRATLKAATEIISSVFQFESSLIVNATYSSFRLSSNTHHPQNTMAAIGQSFPTISYIMTDKSDNMTRMYPQALLKQFTNLPVKPNWAHYDINAQFNSDVNWYFIVSSHLYT